MAVIVRRLEAGCLGGVRVQFWRVPGARSGRGRFSFCSPASLKAPVPSQGIGRGKKTRSEMELDTDFAFRFRAHCRGQFSFGMVLFRNRIGALVLVHALIGRDTQRLEIGRVIGK